MKAFLMRCSSGLTLPRGDGMTILANWRTAKIDTPVLIITARDAIANRVADSSGAVDIW